MRLLVDMNLSPRRINRLADAGIEGVHWYKVGLPVASDTEIMAYARADDYVVLTHDLDFSAILAATAGDRPSVVPIRSEDVSPEGIGAAVIDALRQAEADLARGAPISVDPRRRRLRMLPLVKSEHR